MKAIAYLLAALLMALRWPTRRNSFGPPMPKEARPTRSPIRGILAHNIGFEVDLADALAARMGRKAPLRSEPMGWTRARAGAGEYDAVINGLEITPERAEKINSRTHISIPR
jgi:hypothetical protein